MWWLIYILSLFLSFTPIKQNIDVKSPGEVVVYGFTYNSFSDFDITVNYDTKKLYVDYILFISDDGFTERVYSGKKIHIKDKGGYERTFNIVMKIKQKPFTYPSPVVSTNLNIETNYVGKFEIYTYNNRERIMVSEKTNFVSADHKNNKNLVNINVNY